MLYILYSAILCVMGEHSDEEHPQKEASKGGEPQHLQVPTTRGVDLNPFLALSDFFASCSSSTS